MCKSALNPLTKSPTNPAVNYNTPQHINANVNVHIHFQQRIPPSYSKIFLKFIDILILLIMNIDIIRRGGNMYICMFMMFTNFVCYCSYPTISFTANYFVAVYGLDFGCKYNLYLFDWYEYCKK